MTDGDKKDASILQLHFIHDTVQHKYFMGYKFCRC